MRESLSIAPAVASMYADGTFDKMLRGYAFSNSPALDHDLRSEFKQELSLILLEYKDQKKLLELYASGALGFFILKIIRFQVLSVNSPFYMRHRRPLLKREQSFENHVDTL